MENRRGHILSISPLESLYSARSSAYNPSGWAAPGTGRGQPQRGQGKKIRRRQPSSSRWRDHHRRTVQAAGPLVTVVVVSAAAPAAAAAAWSSTWSQLYSSRTTGMANETTVKCFVRQPQNPQVICLSSSVHIPSSENSPSAISRCFFLGSMLFLHSKQFIHSFIHSFL